MSPKAWLTTWWPHVVAAVVVIVVLGPAAIASYLHARHVVDRHDMAMAPWLPLTTDGLLAAALVVIWAKRRAGQPASGWIWLAFWTGMVATLAANLAAVLDTTEFSLLVEAIVVAVWPPITVAITLELAAVLVAPSRARAPKAPAAGAPVQPSTQAKLAPGADVPTEPAVSLAPPPRELPPPRLPRGEPVSLVKAPRPSSAPPSEPDLFLQILELVEADPGIGRPRVLAELGCKDNDTIRGLLRQAKQTVASRAGAQP